MAKAIETLTPADVTAIREVLGVSVDADRAEAAAGSVATQAASIITTRQQWALRNYVYNGRKTDSSNLWLTDRSFSVPGGASNVKVRNSNAKLVGGTVYALLFETTDPVTGALIDAPAGTSIYFRFNNGAGTFTTPNNGQATRVSGRTGLWLFIVPTNLFTGTTIYAECYATNGSPTAAFNVSAIQAYQTEFPSFEAPVVAVGQGAFKRKQLVVRQNSDIVGETSVFVAGDFGHNDLGIVYLYKPFTGAGGGGFGTNMKRVYEASRSSNENFTRGPQLTDTGQFDFASYVLEGANNFSGGDAHGYEYSTVSAGGARGTGTKVWIDSVEIDPALAQTFVCGTYRRREFSELMVFGTTTKYADREVTWTIDAATGRRTVHNKLTFVKDTVVGPTYMYMHPVSRTRGNLGVDTIFSEVWRPDYPSEVWQTTGNGVTDVRRNSRTIVMEGPSTSGLKVEAEILRGNFHTSWTQFVGPSIKWYVSSTPIPSVAVGGIASDTARTVLTGEVLELFAREKVTNARATL